MKITKFPQATPATPYAAKFGTTVDLSWEELRGTVLGTAYSLSTFHRSERSIKNFQSTEAIGVDVDDGLSLQDAVETLKKLNLQSLVTTSKSHQKEKNGKIADRFRIIIKLSQEITDVAVFASTWNYLNSLFPAMDQQCKNVDRFFFQSGSFITYIEGSHLEPVVAEVKPMKAISMSPTETSAKVIEIPERIILERDITYFLRNAHDLDGSFNGALNKAAFQAARVGLPRNLAYHLLQAAAPSEFDKNDDRTFESGFLSGEKKGIFNRSAQRRRLTEEDVNEALTEEFAEIFHVHEDEQGRRSLILESNESGVCRKVSTDKLSAMASRIVQERFDEFYDSSKCDKAIKNWVNSVTPIACDITPVGFFESKELTFHRLPFKVERGECPNFLELLGRTTNAKALAAFLWSLFVPSSDRQQYVWLYGEGGNGKSSLGDFLSKCLGPSYMAKNAAGSYENKNFTSTLVGKRLAVFEDSNSPRFVQSGTFKEISGGGAVEVEFKYEPAYTSKLFVKFLFFSNFAPEITSKKADLRRLILCHVGPITGNPNPHYTDLLWEERSAILDYCRSCYEGVAANGIIQTDISNAAELASDADLSQESVFSEYLEGGGEIEALDLYNIVRGSLKSHNLKYSAFKEWLIRKKNATMKTTAEGSTFVGISRK